MEKVRRQLEMKRRENKFLDAEIARINVDVTEQSLFRDYTMEEQERKKQAERFSRNHLNIGHPLFIAFLLQDGYCRGKRKTY